MNALLTLVAQVATFAAVIFLFGLGIALIVGGKPAAKKYTRLTLRFTWKAFSATLKVLIDITIRVLKLIRSQL